MHGIALFFTNNHQGSEAVYDRGIEKTRFSIEFPKTILTTFFSFDDQPRHKRQQKRFLLGCYSSWNFESICLNQSLACVAEQRVDLKQVHLNWGSLCRFGFLCGTGCYFCQPCWYQRPSEKTFEDLKPIIQHHDSVSRWDNRFIFFEKICRLFFEDVFLSVRQCLTMLIPLQHCFTVAQALAEQPALSPEQKPWSSRLPLSHFSTVLVTSGRHTSSRTPQMASLNTSLYFHTQSCSRTTPPPPNMFVGYWNETHKSSDQVSYLSLLHIPHLQHLNENPPKIHSTSSSHSSRSETKKKRSLYRGNPLFFTRTCLIQWREGRDWDLGRESNRYFDGSTRSSVQASLSKMERCYSAVWSLKSYAVQISCTCKMYCSLSEQVWSVELTRVLSSCFGEWSSARTPTKLWRHVNSCIVQKGRRIVTWHGSNLPHTAAQNKMHAGRGRGMEQHTLQDGKLRYVETWLHLEVIQHNLARPHSDF